MDQDRKSIANNVLDRIKSGEAKQRPRSYFILRAALLAAGIALLALILLFLASFILFTLRQSGILFISSFGLQGLRVLIVAFPWVLLLVIVLCILLLEVFFKKYSLAYRRPMLYSVAGIVLFVMVGGFVIAQSRLHNTLFSYTRDHRLPIAGPLYQDFGMMHHRNVHAGKIIEMTEFGCIMQTPRGETLAVEFSAQTRFPYGTDLEADDIVVVFGDRDNGRVHALGIRRIEGAIEPFRRHRRPHRMMPAPFFRQTGP